MQFRNDYDLVDQLAHDLRNLAGTLLLDFVLPASSEVRFNVVLSVLRILFRVGFFTNIQEPKFCSNSDGDC